MSSFCHRRSGLNILLALCTLRPDVLVELLRRLQEVPSVREEERLLCSHDRRSYMAGHVGLSHSILQHQRRYVPADPLKPEMKARRSSHWAMYSLKSGGASGAIVRVPRVWSMRKVLALVFRRHHEGLYVDLWLAHELSESL